MNGLLPRVFISSVMEGYAAFRDAAAKGIRRAGCEPVRAEDFPASLASPRSACLDGIRSVDAVVLLLGARYGWTTPSGLSATEEEYDEARHTPKQIFVFLEDVESREPQQEEFVRKVQDYIGGHWRKTFCESDELHHLVQEAIIAADLVSAQMSEDAVVEKLTEALSSKPSDVQGIVWIKIVWMTPRAEEVVDPLLFADSDFQHTIMRLGHESDPPLLAYEHSKKPVATAKVLQVIQGDPTAWRNPRDLVTLELDTQGTLSISQNVSGTAAEVQPDYEGFDMFFLDPTIVQERLARAWAFAAAWWEHHDPYRRHDQLLYAVALYDVGTRSFSKPRRSPFGGITIPAQCPHDPLFLFDRPRSVARAAFTADAHAEIEKTCKLLDLRFKEWENQW